MVDNLVDHGVPRNWWPWLGAAEAVGATELLAGLAVPAIGVTAAAGLVAYFAGAVVTIVRAHAYAHLHFPLPYVVPALAAGWLAASA